MERTRRTSPLTGAFKDVPPSEKRYADAWFRVKNKTKIKIKYKKELCMPCAVPGRIFILTLMISIKTYMTVAGSHRPSLHPPISYCDSFWHILLNSFLLTLLTNNVTHYWYCHSLHPQSCTHTRTGTDTDADIDTDIDTDGDADTGAGWVDARFCSREKTYTVYIIQSTHSVGFYTVYIIQRTYSVGFVAWCRLRELLVLQALT